MNNKTIEDMFFKLRKQIVEIADETRQRASDEEHYGDREGVADWMRDEASELDDLAKTVQDAEPSSIGAEKIMRVIENAIDLNRELLLTEHWDAVSILIICGASIPTKHSYPNIFQDGKDSGLDSKWIRARATYEKEYISRETSPSEPGESIGL